MIKFMTKVYRAVDYFIVNGIDNIKEDSYKPDEDKFNDFLEFTKKYPKKGYLEFREFCWEKNKGKD
ncbi:unnamed protein product [marine sediment metagenome]|uniref:Uncharacterized protein n=1 Tax=marine sediment metagenome TaxID=412755 RepID=X1TU38_9ZZZZ